MSWRKLKVNPEEFNLRATLNSGQAFRWLFSEELGEWHGVINGTLWRLCQSNESQPVFYYDDRPACKDNKTSDVPVDLTDYFRLDVDISELLQVWRERDRRFADRSSPALLPKKSVYTVTEACGIRLLRQDPVETLFAFIASANNNVPRISGLLNNLSKKFGEPLRSSRDDIVHWRFPSLDKLSGNEMETHLRELGFGYRSKFIPAAARWLLSNGGANRLYELRLAPAEEARQFLLNIPGIGNKVADCICLSSLDKTEIVPVDVHMLQAARDRGLIGSNIYGLTTQTYRSVSKSLSAHWGLWAGWAQAIEFATRIRSTGTSRKRKWKSVVGSDTD
ncbi:unnamed protein product [Calicophoron daubneyi]|uniref:DNA-(apurinic or apyrimidinic site) lyase n=1 Tax=Calicophoron daubneyi TaxID=300641 RepID=A0AAV2THW2_CALDB